MSHISGCPTFHDLVYNICRCDISNVVACTLSLILTLCILVPLIPREAIIFFVCLYIFTSDTYILVPLIIVLMITDLRCDLAPQGSHHALAHLLGGRRRVELAEEDVRLLLAEDHISTDSLTPQVKYCLFSGKQTN